MTIAQLAPILTGPNKGSRLYGLGRSLVIYYGQPWRTRAMTRFYQELIRPGSLAFDVGAHVGNRTRCWWRLGARVVAVEPQPDLVAWLRFAFAGIEQVKVIDTALAAESGSQAMHVSRRNPTVTTFSGAWIDQVGRTDAFSQVTWEAPVEVPATTLDRLISEHGMPEFCKIDVEGFEAEVLKGLSKAIPTISVEFLPAAIDVALESVRLLQRLGSYRFNVSLGERMELLWSSWQEAKTMQAWLEQRHGRRQSGDIYARIEG